MAFAFIAPTTRRAHTLFAEADYERQRAFFRARPHLGATPLRPLPGLARALGVADLRIKDETERFGLNAFKATGALFAVAALAEEGTLRPGDTLVCASEGNHGRAVAHAARQVKCASRVYVSASVAAPRVAAIEREGATVVRVEGTYDDALRVMASEAQRQGWRVISDTALAGEPVDIPRLIMLGYTKLMDEAAEQWGDAPPPDVVFVPGGVGGLLGAVADWVHASAVWRHTRVICVEPETAACLLVSARKGQPTTIAGPFDTTMAGLRCGEVSRASFDTVQAGVAAYLAIEDAWAFEAMRRLSRGVAGDPRINAGASGAAALAGLLALTHDPTLSPSRAALGFDHRTRVLALVTEGVTDPGLFAAVVASPKNGHLISRDPEP